MENQFTILGYGKSGVHENWANRMNNSQFADRIYYILCEGAGYIIDGEKHYFIKNHLYLINHRSNIEFFVEDFAFYHAYIDYNSAIHSFSTPVIDIFAEKDSLLEADINAFLRFVEKNEFGNFRLGKKIITPSKFGEKILLLLKSLLWDIGELYPLKETKSKAVAESLQYIHSHFPENISVSMLSESVFLSENQFSRVFLRETGLTPYQYIKEYRFDVARVLLKSGLSISETAQQCGFMSGSAFSSSFKKRFGFSPLKFMQKCSF